MTTVDGGHKDFHRHRATIYWENGKLRARAEGVPGTHEVVFPGHAPAPIASSLASPPIGSFSLNAPVFPHVAGIETEIVGTFSVKGPYLLVTAYTIAYPVPII